MNINENKVIWYLYDKQDCKVSKQFYHKYEIKKFLESRMRDSDMPENLSMTMKDEYKEYYDLIYSPDTDKYYKYNSVYYLKNTEVIIDNYGRIFNYMEMVYEIVSKRTGVKINYGEGYTYSGNPCMPKSYWNRPRKFWYCGSKPHGSSNGKLIVSMREAVQSYDIPRQYYEELFLDDEPYDVDVKMLKKAMKSMRSYRRNLTPGMWWDDRYTEEYVKNGRPASWKRQKKRKQWERK